METLNGLPVLLAHNISKKSCKTEPCPYCGRRHTHGSGELGTVHHKVAHCPPLKDVGAHNFRDVWKWVKANPTLAAFLEKNPGYYVKIVE